MKMNMKVTALIYSSNQPAEVTITEMIGNNKYLVDYRGILCAAMFNPFSGMYYVDDVNGRIPKMSKKELNSVLYELRFLEEATDKELRAYRSLGSVSHLKKLREQEIRREKNWKVFKNFSKNASILMGVAVLVCIFVAGFVTIFA